MNKEFYDKYINISEEEMIKGSIYAECRCMDKEDVYAWVYQDELKIKKQKEVIDKVVECLNLWQIPECDKGTMREILFNTNKQNVLDILKEVSK